MGRSRSRSRSNAGRNLKGDEGNKDQDQHEGVGVHLIVLIHGLYGNTSNLAVVKQELERATSLASTSRSRSSSSSSSSSSAYLISKDDRSPSTDSTHGREDVEREGEEEEDEVDSLLESQNRYSGRTILPSTVLVLKSFEGSHTWDGIDINAQRAAQEVR